MFQSFAILLTLATIFSYINYRWFKLPTTIGLMIMAFLTAITIIGSKSLVPDLYTFFCELVIGLDFKTILMEMMLSFLLFAGALHVNIQDLKEQRKPVLLFATIGVLISTLLVGGAIYFIAPLLGLSIPFLHCLVFGALISPTDPIAVIAILKEAKVSKSVELKIEGESLFNDGIGVVVFTGILLLIEGQHMMEGGESIGKEVLFLFAEEAVGGVLYGLLIGFVAWKLIKSIQENTHLAILLTLSIALGGYSLASLIHVSGPLAMVVAGLLIGNKINGPNFSNSSRASIGEFWEILDDTLNAVLFVLIGLVIHLLSFEMSYFYLGLISILVVIISRFISVYLPFSLLKHQGTNLLKTVGVLTWGGLRGGISVALALSLDDSYSREPILFITYIVVLFSIIVQGLSLGKVVKKLNIN